MNHKNSAWPELTAESRPWTRWWWLGSAVNKGTITALLELYHRAGLGGIEVTSIYAVKGQEANNIDYLSPRWVEMIQHTIAEAKRLGMAVDLPPGSGWRIGGEFITDAVSAAKLTIRKKDDGSGYTAESKPSNEQVKRAGPGAEGRAFNPFSRTSLQSAMDHLGSAFKDLGFRAQFHDSWEYESSACPEIFDRFLKMRGYDVRDHLDALAGDATPDLNARVRYDFQLTLAELALDEFIAPWTAWCHELGQLSRNQAHGSPGNLLDLYAAADIPETEVFRRITPDTPLISKFASSAAHVTGKPLVSSETGTWIQEHFHVALSDLKRLCDNLFVSGINHHVYHGTAYSPPNAAWPGWLFYASTQLNPQNSIWRDVSKLNEYVTRCQLILQEGESANDLLVYFPVHDILHNPNRRLASGLQIKGDWLLDTLAMKTLRYLWEHGYGFDYISDRQISEVQVANESAVTDGGEYQAIVVPPCEYMPVATLERLHSLSRQGLRVIFLTPAPADVPGLAGLEEHRVQFKALVAQMTTSSDCGAALSKAGVQREKMTDYSGLQFVRRKHDTGYYYFLVNESDEPIDEFVTLVADFESVMVMDPMSGNTGRAQTRGNTGTEIRVQLWPGDSLILRTSSEAEFEPTPWRYLDFCGDPFVLQGTWKIEFIEGGPELPDSFETDALASWTDRSHAAARFAGTAIYRLEFDAPAKGSTWLLDLGQVHSSARVRLNDKKAETLIGPSFRTTLSNVRARGNLLEIEVTNLAANRIRDLDRRGIEWKLFDDINFVNREYGPFDAANWPVVSSGLRGPVRIIPLIHSI
jgi:hypothetical protein